MNLSKYLAFFPLIIILTFSSCKKDEILEDSSAKLAFSTDSILFDTVFTSMGSTTKSFKIYNKHSRPLNISKIYLAGGSNSSFKLNVDGVSGKSINDMEIAGGDSLFVFVQVTVNPTGASSPMLIKDSVIFETNGNTQDVKLIAIGQDVYLHIPDHFPTNGFPAYSIMGPENTTVLLPNDKPHLFFGYTVIDSDCKLTMQAGTKCYFYNHAVLWVYDKGTLIVDGDLGNEVVFQGYRQESEYKDTPGQWGKIWISQGSKNNKINYAIIKNGGIGLQVDSVVTPGVPTLELTNTIIKNMTAAALYAQGSWIEGSNCVFSNCGQYTAALTIGGYYNFEHCTFANYWSGSEARTTPLLYLNNYFVNGSTVFVRPLAGCNFKNCILYGNQEEEIGLDSITGVTGGYFLMPYHFDHCLLRTNRAVSGSGTESFYNSCEKNLDPGFTDPTAGDYQLRADATNSLGKGAAPTVILDIKKNPRGPTPDLGAYEQ
jgi:hypothetical protein